MPHVIPLLAWDPVAGEAVNALRRTAEERVGELIDALIDPNQEFAVRRRLARVFSVCVSQRAVDGLMLGLDDQRFEVRFQCARSLAAIVEKNPRVRIDSSLIFEVVRREAAVGRPVWESHRLLNQLEDHDEYFRRRVREGPREPEPGSRLHAALARAAARAAADRVPRSAHRRSSGSAAPRSSISKACFRRRSGNVCGRSSKTRVRRSSGPARPRDEILADLLRSHDSIVLNLEELQRRVEPPSGKPWHTT